MMYVETKYGMVTYDGFEYKGPKQGAKQLKKEIKKWAPDYGPEFGYFLAWVADLITFDDNDLIVAHVSLPKRKQKDVVF